MAESSPRDPVMSNLFQGMSEDTIRLALTMAQLMESKDGKNLEAVMKTLNLTEMPGVDDTQGRPTDSETLKNGISPDANGSASQTKPDEQNEEKQSVPITTTPTLEPTSSQSEQLAVTPTTTVENQAEQHMIQHGPSPNENHHPGASTDDAASSTPGSAQQSSGSELSKAEDEEKSTPDRDQGNSGQFEATGNLVNGNYKNANSKEDAATTVMNSSQNDDSASSAEAPRVDLEVNPTNEKTVPIPNGFSSVVHSAQNSEDKKLSGGFRPKDFSDFSKEKEIPKETTHHFDQEENIGVSKTSESITVDPETHNANYSAVTRMSELGKSDQTGQTSLTGLNSALCSQPKELDNGRVGSSLPNNTTANSGLTGLKTAPQFMQREHQEGFTSTSPSNTPRQSGLTGLKATPQQPQKEVVGGFSGQSILTSLKATPFTGQSSLTGLSSTSRQQHREHFEQDESRLPGARKNQAQNEERPYSQEKQDTCSISTTAQTSHKLDSHFTSASLSMPLVSEGTSSSIMTASSAMASMPLYYQPHIVMKDNIPVLMLKPVLVPSLSSDGTGSPTMDLGASSMVFPLNSVQGFGTHPHVNDITLSTDAVDGKLQPKQDSEQEPGSEYAYSTESESEEKAPNIARMERKGDWITWTYLDDNDDPTSMYQTKNPFLDDEDNLSTTSSQPFTSNTVPVHNFGHQVSSDIYQHTSSPSSNPFYPDEQADVLHDDGLSCTEFSTIPKSMLASQRVPHGGPPVNPNSTSVPRVPPVSQAGGFSTSQNVNEGLSRGPQAGQFGSTTPLRVPPVEQFSCASPLRVPAVSQFGSTTPLRVPPVEQFSCASPLRVPTASQFGSTTPLRGHPVSQANFNGTSLTASHTSQRSATSLPVGPPVSHSYGTSGEPAQSFGAPLTNHQQWATQQLTKGPPVSQHGSQPQRGPQVVQNEAQQPLRGPPVSQQYHSLTKPNQSPASNASSTFPGQQRPIGNMVTNGNMLDSVTSNDSSYQSLTYPSPSPVTPNFTAATVMSSTEHGTNDMTAGHSTTAISVGNREAHPSTQPTSKPQMPGHVAPYWVPDDQVFKCSYCHLKFNMVRRKHHCRGCGKIFCSNCCSQLARLSYLQYQIQRICINCTRIIKEASKERKQDRARRQQAAKQKTSKLSFSTHEATPPQASPIVTAANTPSLTGLTDSVHRGERVESTRASDQQLSNGNSALGATASPVVQSDASAFQKPAPQNSGETPELKIPVRAAGKVVSWKGETFASKLMAQDRKKALAKDLKELPYGVTMQIADDLQLIVRKVKVQSSPLVHVWCCISKGLTVFEQQEVAMYFKVKLKEEVIPEEVLRMYKVILDLVKLGHIFKHSNFLAFKSPFLGTYENAALLFASSALVRPPQALSTLKSNFLYAILVKRSELEYAQLVPTRYLLRLGQEFKSFPFPIINSRDRATVYDGVDPDDIIYNITVALNKHLRNSVPEAIIPGLTVLQEDSKVVLQIPVESQAIVVNFFDRLVIKNHQRATIPLVSDLSINVDQYRVYHQSIHTDEISLRKHMSLFRNPESQQRIGVHSVTGLGFILLLLGADDTASLEQKGKLVDDGAIVNLTDQQTQKLRQCLREFSNFSLYLGEHFEVLYFELRWSQEPINHLQGVDSRTKQEQAPLEHPGTATIEVRHSGHSSELKKVAEARLGDTLIVIRLLEQRIKRAATEALMLQANKMKAGETKEIILKLSLRNGMKKWAIGPASQPMYLIRSLQMALYDIKLTDLGKASFDLTFDVTVIKQFDLIAQRFENQ